MAAPQSPQPGSAQPGSTQPGSAQPGSAAALAAKIAAEGVYVIESKLYSVRVPVSFNGDGPVAVITAGTHGPGGGYKKRVVLWRAPGNDVLLAFSREALMNGSSDYFCMASGFKGPYVFMLQPGQSLWAIIREIYASPVQRLSVATNQLGDLMIKSPQPGSAAELDAKIAAEGIYVIESKLYTKRVPGLTEDRGPAVIATAGTHGPDGGYKKRVVLLLNSIPDLGAFPVHLAFAEQELVNGAAPTSATFMFTPFEQPLVLILQPGQSIWGRSSGDAMLVSVATSVA